MKNLIVYSESCGQFLSKDGWTTTTQNAQTFNTADEAITEVKRRMPGKVESIAILNFVQRQVVNLTSLVKPGSGL